MDVAVQSRPVVAAKAVVRPSHHVIARERLKEVRNNHAARAAMGQMAVSVEHRVEMGATSHAMRVVHVPKAANFALTTGPTAVDKVAAKANRVPMPFAMPVCAGTAPRSATNLAVRQAPHASPIHCEPASIRSPIAVATVATATETQAVVHGDPAVLPVAVGAAQPIRCAPALVASNKAVDPA